MREVKLLTGISGMILWNVTMQNDGVRLFSDQYYSGTHHIDFTPYYKGNLWKLRVYLSGRIEVYHGTVKMWVASNLASAINSFPAYRDDKFLKWKLKMKRKI